MTRSLQAKKHRIIPGFRLTLGYTIFYLTLIVLVPLSTLFFKTASGGWAHFTEAILSPRTLAAYRLSFGTAFAAAGINAAFGFLIAWVLARYTFPGKRLVDAMVDLPLALPTAVAGIAFATIYASKGWFGQYFALFGVKVAFTPLGIIVALAFTGLPFVVRTIQPVLEDLDPAIEEAAASLGAGRLQIFLKVLFPTLLPSLITGVTMAFARALGEYGSVVFIAGNMPMKTEIAPLLIITKLEQYDYAGATAIAVVMLAASFALFMLVNRLQRLSSEKIGMVP